MGDERSVDPTPLKKARTGDLKRVAEIVMVLSAMGEMRGGKDPTAVEKALAAEARERLTGICEAEFKPKDLISREAVRVVVEDLGLNRIRDPMMGFRPTKMSISEKLLLNKRKMEESKSFTSHPSVYSSQHLPGESHGTLMHGTPKFLPDRQSPMAFSTGSFQSISPGVHISTINASSLKQSHVSETHVAATPLKSSSSPVDKDSPLLAQSQSHAGAPHLRFDGRFNGPPYLAHVQAASAEKTSSTSSVQSTSAVSVKPSQPNNLLDHTQGKSEGALAANSLQTKDQVVGNQEAKIPEVHGAVINLPIGHHQPAQGVMFVPGPSFFTTHEDISKSVQKMLQPKVFDHPNWNPPSAEYTNKPINCQICKVTVTDIESLLVCDACEKGTHLKCLQSYDNKDGFPKAEWYCPRCLVTSNGKPFPPKYGRVTRTIAPQKAPSNTVASSASSEKRPELASKVNQQKPVANGNSGLAHLVHASSSATNCSVLNLDSKTPHAVDIQSGMKKEDELSPVTSTNNSTEQTGLSYATPHAEAGNSDKDLKTSGSWTCNMDRSTFEALPDQQVESGQSCPENPQDTAIETVNQSQAPSESEEVEVPISLEVPANQQEEIASASTAESKEPPKQQGESEQKIGCDVRSADQDNCQAAPSGKPNIDASKQLELKETSKCEGNDNTLLDSQDKAVTPNGAIDNDGYRVYGKPSVPVSDAVHWLGGILQVIDEKTYYQSFQINGVSHKLQNHVLVSSSSQNSLPSKLQSLWEDKKTGSKWAVVNQYYFPSDLPEVANCPSTPENNEVYASNKENTIMASSICGSCEVMSVQKFKDEIDRRTHLRDADSSLHPVFMCSLCSKRIVCADGCMMNQRGPSNPSLINIAWPFSGNVICHVHDYLFNAV